MNEAMKKIKDLILKHFQDNYCVKSEHPTDDKGVSTDCVYHIVAPKSGGKGRGEMHDHEFEETVLKELNFQPTEELRMLIRYTSNEFVETNYGRGGKL